MTFKDTKYGDLSSVKLFTDKIEITDKIDSLEGCPQSMDNTLVVSNTGLKSLQYAPTTIMGGFYCEKNKLRTLQYCPTTVSGTFSISENYITSLKGCPTKVDSFYCRYNNLKDLEGGPTVVNSSYNCANNKLVSLKGSPNKIPDSFNCSGNYLSSLIGGPDEVDDFNCGDNELTDLIGSPYVKGRYMLAGNKTLTTLNGIQNTIFDDLVAHSCGLTSLENAPKTIRGTFEVQWNENLKNPKEQIIKYQIKAESYSTDEGSFKFEDIKEEFEAEQLKSKVQSKGFRTLLGLK